jgi:hypothetical protein
MLKKIAFLLCMLTLLSAALVFAQTTASIKGNVIDSSGAAVVGAKITVKSAAQGIERSTTTGTGGDYEVPLLPPGVYSVKVEQSGFQPQQADRVVLEVSQNVVQNFNLKIANSTETVTVEGTAPVVESTTMTVGQTIDQRQVQEIPLNGRHFVDLALLVPGSVTPPQNGFLTAPLRGQGSFAVNTAGNREDAVNWMINGINLNDMVQNQVTFQPTINTVSEFKVDNSTYSAEYGRNSGAIVNIASRSGTNQYHGELYDYIRNDFFDARNAFNPTTSSTGAPLRENPFKRNQFGGDFGGPIVKDKTFFFVTYEGLRHRQGLALTSNVFPDSSPNPATITRSTIAAAGKPVANALLGLIPHANTTIGSSPVPNAFTGSGVAPVDIDQGTVDINHNFNDSDRIHGYYVYQHDLRIEAAQGTDIPNFGDTREGHRQVFTLNETHVFSSNVVNEGNLGVNRILITFTPNTTVSPTSLGLATALGPNEQFMPTISVGDQGLLFGAERGFPQGRGDTTSVVGDTLSYIKGRHSFKFGGEFRDFHNDNFNGDPGQLIYNNSTQFQNDTPATAARTIGSVANRITQNALDFFAMDSFKFRPSFTLELGIRYAWNMSPSEAQNRFTAFVPGGATGSMLVPISQPYAQNNKNFQPRVGFAWDVLHNGKTVLRAGYAYQVDEPITGMVTGLSSNPPFALPLSVGAQTPITALGALFTPTTSGAKNLSPAVVNPNFKDADVQSWNLNIQQEITHTSSIMVGYFASKGTHLEIDENINQFTTLGVPASKPFISISPSSPIQPNATLANNITERNTNSNSTYNALWLTGTKQMSHGLLFNASYTYSHSIDEASRNLEGIVVQDSTNILSGKGSSDFDARHRFVANAVYDFPFKGNRFISGWEVAPIVTLQSGNPYTIVIPTAGLTGVGNTVYPIATGPIVVTGNPFGQWVSPSNFANPATQTTFGNVGRNSVVGPDFKNFDLALAKNTKLTERMSLQLRCDAFDLFNHPNFGQPSRVLSSATSTTFGLITSTRFPTGDSGSSRQLQLAMKLMF